DHIAALPLLLDTVFGTRATPLEVHASAAVQQILREHIFNWRVWPDFSKLPDERRPVMQLVDRDTHETFKLGGYRVTSVEVNHVVPCCAYIIETQQGVFCFSGDTTTTDELWTALNRMPRLDLLFVECAFPDREEQLAGVAKHYCPSSLAKDLQKLRHDPVICVSHFKPGSEAETFAQLRDLLPQRKLQVLEPDQLYTV
ncbi:MAG: 3',5'-cyclic-nucleotide phosphodiesterase, partial [Gammaproteobacteria bacterium]|nr:3',5'-cyclic-nucleotide phosphodiesterase [Gammaproteobacteria bacterium]